MRENYHTKTSKKLFLYPDEWDKFFDLLKEKQQPYFKIAISTGARVNEIRHIKPVDINKNRDEITFRITKVKAVNKEKRPEPRTIQISSQLKNWLTRYIKLNKIKNNQYICHSNSRDKPISKVAIHKILKNNLKKIRPNDYMDFSSHNIRKTHGMWLLALNVPHSEVAMRLGHDIKTLTKHYASPTLLKYEDRVLIRQNLGDLYQEIAKY